MNHESINARINHELDELTSNKFAKNLPQPKKNLKSFEDNSPSFVNNSYNNICDEFDTIRDKFVYNKFVINSCAKDIRVNPR
jgi:hypothetical protein